MTTLSFASLGVSEPLLRALDAQNYSTPTPIQARAIPPLLAGNDLLGIAQTGTGKTAAFTLPILQQLAEAKLKPERGKVTALILTPTRELAAQISDSVRTYGRFLKLHHTAVFGGVGFQPQINALARGVDILIATPGRLMDLMRRGHVKLDKVSFLVLDEADRMLDMGFAPDVNRIIAACPKARQSLLFSATMPTAIRKLAEQILENPVRVEVTPAATTVERIEQHVFHVDARVKRTFLTTVMNDPALSRVIIFTRTKHGADRVAEVLDKAGIPADAIHGNKSQGARQRALDNFRRGRSRAIVATDIMARGIDVDGVTHVINYELPNDPESYVHRIGRTARAGAEGVALSFCDASERGYLRDIERLTKQKLKVMPGPDGALEPAHAANANSNNGQAKPKSQQHQQRRRPPHRKGKRAA